MDSAQNPMSATAERRPHERRPVQRPDGRRDGTTASRGASAAVPVLQQLSARYEQVHAELGRTIDRNTEDTPERIWQRRHEHIEYLFGVLDGLRVAINALDPALWRKSRLRDFTVWEASLERGDPMDGPDDVRPHGGH